MSKFSVKKNIPKYAEAGEVGKYLLQNIGGIGVEPLTYTSPAGVGMDNPYGLVSPDDMTKRYSSSFDQVSQPSLPGQFKGSLSAISDNYMNNAPSFGDYLKREGSNDEDNDPTNFATFPILASSDLASRAAQLGRGVERMTTGKGNLSNTIGTVASGVSLALGTAREIYGLQSSDIGTRENMRLARERLANQKRDSMMEYYGDGGAYTGKGEKFDTSSLSGQYVYPLPEAMDDQANVEVEKGEYVILPGGIPQEVLGDKHSDGGVDLSVEPGTRIITDKDKVDQDFAKKVRETFGISATPKDTYATLMDRYKSRIGLKSAYEDQEKALKRLEKNEKIKDDNTRRLNESVLSKAINDNNKSIEGMEVTFKSFSEMIYSEQERKKNEAESDAVFGEGGMVDMSILKREAKRAGVSEDEAKSFILDKITSAKRKMAEGGIFGRKLRFRPVSNKWNNEVNEFGYQPETGGNTYGMTGVSENPLGEFSRLFPGFTTGSVQDASAKAKLMEDYYSDVTGSWMNLSSMRNPLVEDPEALRNYTTAVSFGGEDNPGGYPGPQDVGYASKAKDQKLGRFHMSRPNIGLDVVSMDQQRALNEAGITNFSQLFDDNNRKKVSDILGEDILKMQTLRSTPGMEGLDFVIDAYNPEMGATPAGVGVTTATKPLGDTITPSAGSIPVSASTTKGGDNKKGNKDGDGSLFDNYLNFPEIFRMAPSSVTAEGLERHRAPTVDPVLRNAQQYITESNRVFQTQLDSLDSVPDSQRGALISNLQAVMGTNVGKYISEVEGANVAQRTQARNFNEQSFSQTDDKNILERQRYQQGMLQGLAINEENWNRYFDSVNDEIQQKWKTSNDMNTLRSIFPNFSPTSGGGIKYVPSGDILSYKMLYNQQDRLDEANKKKK